MWTCVQRWFATPSLQPQELWAELSQRNRHALDALPFNALQRPVSAPVPFPRAWCVRCAWGAMGGLQWRGAALVPPRAAGCLVVCVCGSSHTPCVCVCAEVWECFGRVCVWCVLCSVCAGGPSRGRGGEQGQEELMLQRGAAGGLGTAHPTKGAGASGVTAALRGGSLNTCTHTARGAHVHAWEYIYNDYTPHTHIHVLPCNTYVSMQHTAHSSQQGTHAKAQLRPWTWHGVGGGGEGTLCATGAVGRGGASSLPIPPHLVMPPPHSPPPTRHSPIVHNSQPSAHPALVF